MGSNSENNLYHNGTSETCNDCLAIWEWKDTSCPECGSNDIEEYHEVGCDCKYCEQGKRELIDHSIEEEEY